MPDGKKGHMYFRKPTGKSLLFVLGMYDIFLPLDELKYFYIIF